MSVKKGKKGVKKKIRSLIFILLLLLVVLLLLLLFMKVMIGNNNYYRVDSRFDEVQEAKKTDADDYRTVGWLKIQGTNIDMPVLQGTGDDFESPVEKKKYSWMLEHDGKFHNKVNIFGHNIFNLSSSPKIGQDFYERFEDLMSFVYYDFAKENKYIQFTIDGKEYVYKIFAVNFMYASDVQQFPEGEISKDDMKLQLDFFKKKSIYDYDVDVDYDDDLISLITCTRFFGLEGYEDFAVTGRLLRDGEKADDYSVKRNKNYEKVDEILKGDDSNEETSA